MLFSLALKNIKKSIKDYSIYFFTLVVGVAIFYIFNSLDAQKSMLIMSESRYEIVKTLIYLLGYVSVFISIILGFLIVYSNNFLIKRRKKEFGLYLTLGMSKFKVSAILVLETLLVGIFSLIVGLVCGVFLSQFLSLFTAKLFEVNLTAFKFVFSSSALIKTLIYFGIIFALVMIFNIISLSKNKLIDLLTADRKNEKIKMRNKLVIAITFVLAAGLLGYAYYKLFNGVLFSMDKQVIYMLIAGSLGTYFLFFSLAGIFLRVSELNKKFYFKNLNMFVLKQVNSKANSSVLSTTIISLMLLLTIGILSGAISLVSIFNQDMDKNNRTDVTIDYYVYSGVVSDDGEIVVRKNEGGLYDLPNQKFFNEYVSDYAIYSSYASKTVTMESLMDEKTIKRVRSEYGEELSLVSSLEIMSESDYNKIMNLYGLEEVKLKENEYLLTANVAKAMEFYKTKYANKGTITIGNKELVPATKDIVEISFRNYSGESNFGTVIVPDEMVGYLEGRGQTLIANYVENNDIEKFEDEFLTKCRENGEFTALHSTTKLEMKNSSIGIKAILIFVGMYLGIIFAISSATVLAIGQLSESSDNKDRYLVLKQIGADDKMINKALFSQIAIAFILPLVVALFHAFFGLRELNGIIELLGNIDLTKSIILTTCFIVLVYGGYFMATYLVSKNIIKNN